MKNIFKNKATQYIFPWVFPVFFAIYSLWACGRDFDGLISPCFAIYMILPFFIVGSALLMLESFFILRAFYIKLNGGAKSSYRMYFYISIIILIFIGYMIYYLKDI